MKPLISIIIPTFNRAHLLGETLDSVLGQTYPHWECIVVDDGSEDATETLVLEYAERDDRFVLLMRPEHRANGGNAARNFGFEHAKGTYIQWFDSDDLMDKNLLQYQLQHILKNNAAFSMCNHDRYNEDFTTLKRKGVAYESTYGYYLDYVTGKLAANLPTILFSRAVVTPYQLSETLYKSQEFEFLQRFLKENEDKGTYLNKSLVHVRRHQDSITEKITPIRLNSALEVILKTHQSLPDEAPTEVRKHLAIKYLKTLYIANKQKMTRVFVKHTFQLYRFSLAKALLSVPYSLLIYGMSRLGIMHVSQFKRIYKFYQ